MTDVDVVQHCCWLVSVAPVLLWRLLATASAEAELGPDVALTAASVARVLASVLFAVASHAGAAAATIVEPAKPVHQSVHHTSQPDKTLLLKFIHIFSHSVFYIDLTNKIIFERQRMTPVAHFT